MPVARNTGSELDPGASVHFIGFSASTPAFLIARTEEGASTVVTDAGRGKVFVDEGLELEVFMLDFVRAGRRKPFRLGRLYRPAQDHVGDRLSALGRLLHRSASVPYLPRRSTGLAGGAMGFYGLQ
jgi:hypothetical protein